MSMGLNGVFTLSESEHECEKYTGVSMAPQNGLTSSKIFLKKVSILEFDWRTSQMYFPAKPLKKCKGLPTTL